MDSTPGYPHVALGSSNEKVLEKYGNVIWDTVLEQFNNALRLGEEVFSLSPTELIQFGICDPVKVFVKGEPHSRAKLDAGKLRIISSVSLVDQIKTRLLCSQQNKAEINSWQTCPSKPGLGLHDDGLASIADTIKDFLSHGKVIETDVSGWDWSVADWELRVDAECRRLLARARKGGVFDFLLRVHAHCVANSVFVTPDGEMYAQTIPGGQLSGDYNTSSTNSRMRVVASMMARLWATGSPLVNGCIGIAAMGDDSFEMEAPGIGEGLQLMGHSVKFLKENATLDGVNFCSQVFTSEGTAYPEDPSKTVFRFLSHKHGEQSYLELWVQLNWYLRHLPHSVISQTIQELAFARAERAKNFNGKSQQSQKDS
nr:MAG: putative RNA-dependent RNA polymerase [Barnaviridae sp.]